jgi:hypothetical protein
MSTMTQNLREQELLTENLKQIEKASLSANAFGGAAKRMR